MTRKIPPYIVNEDRRRKLAEVADHIKTLEEAHRKLVEKAQQGQLTGGEADLLRRVIAAHENLEKKWRILAPSLSEALIQLQKP